MTNPLTRKSNGLLKLLQDHRCFRILIGHELFAVEYDRPMKAGELVCYQGQHCRDMAFPAIIEKLDAHESSCIRLQPDGKFDDYPTKVRNADILCGLRPISKQLWVLTMYSTFRGKEKTQPIHTSDDLTKLVKMQQDLVKTAEGSEESFIYRIHKLNAK